MATRRKKVVLEYLIEARNLKQAFINDHAAILEKIFSGTGTNSVELISSEFAHVALKQPKCDKDRNLAAALQNLPHEQKSILAAFQRFHEVTKIQDILHADIFAFKNRIPRKYKFDSSEHMRRLISSHLSAIYILKDRLKKFCNRLQIDRKDRVQDIKLLSKTIINLANDVFEKELKLRNLFTHEIEYDDPDLYRLSLCELVLKGEPSRQLQEKLAFLYSELLRKYRREWAKRAAKNAENADILVGFTYQATRDLIPGTKK